MIPPHIQPIAPALPMQPADMAMLATLPSPPPQLQHSPIGESQPSSPHKGHFFHVQHFGSAQASQLRKTSAPTAQRSKGLPFEYKLQETAREKYKDRFHELLKVEQGEHKKLLEEK